MNSSLFDFHQFFIQHAYYPLSPFGIKFRNGKRNGHHTSRGKEYKAVFKTKKETLEGNKWLIELCAIVARFQVAKERLKAEKTSYKLLRTKVMDRKSHVSVCDSGVKYYKSGGSVRR